MIQLPQPLKSLILNFSKLNGVGERTALRYVLQILQWDKSDQLEFAKNLSALKDVRNCQKCGVLSDLDCCPICADQTRVDHGVICVVEGISDLIAIEKSGQFSGTYHILGGVLNPLAGIGPDKLRVKELIERIRDKHVQELVLAINPSVEGEATCSYLKDLLPDFVSMKRIGFGVPIGGNLEFLDPLTIMKAFENKSNL